mgnify:CR=1 FL=1
MNAAASSRVGEGGPEGPVELGHIAKENVAPPREGSVSMEGQ